MNLGLRELAGFLARHKKDHALVLATVVATEGSSYRKPGAMMLIRENHEFAGLISGGCLEGDLVENASEVFASGDPKLVTYDLSSDDDNILGLGLGCGGVIHLFLQRLDRDDGFAFMPALIESVTRRSECLLALSWREGGDVQPGTWALACSDVESLGDDRLSAGLDAALNQWEGGKRYRYTGPGESILLTRVKPSPRVLICGAGPDAVPVARQVDALGWDTVVVDHRSAYATADRFPECTRVLHIRPAELGKALDPGDIDAAIVMTHNLEHDSTYLAQLVTFRPAYLGLLGPKARRLELQSELGIGEGLIHGPAGFDIGAELPESIALSIVAEMHARLSLGTRSGDQGD